MKDPAVLFFISDWLTSTSEMDADCRGWYLNLILHNYDKGDLPNEIEKLAVLAGVKFSEFTRFEQVFKQVLIHKFEQVDKGRLSNNRTQSVLRSRETFKDKRSEAGKKSYLMRFFAKHFIDKSKNEKIYQFVSNNIDTSIDVKNQECVEQMFKQVLEQYKDEKGSVSVKEIKEQIPDFEIFKAYALDKKGDVNIEHLKLKYQSWVEAGWKTGKGAKIKNWKSTLLHTLPYIDSVIENKKSDNFSISKMQI